MDFAGEGEGQHYSACHRLLTFVHLGHLGLQRHTFLLPRGEFKDDVKCYVSCTYCDTCYMAIA